MTKKLCFLAILFILVHIPLFSQQFQRTTGGNGYYRNLGNVGFLNPTNFWQVNSNIYLDENLYKSGQYTSVIRGNIWRVNNVIDVPDSIKTEILNTKIANGTAGEPCLLEEFIFPYKWGHFDQEAYLIIVIYGQETWGYLDCASAFIVIMG